MRSLRKAIVDNEAWLMERVRDYAQDRGYSRYTSTLIAAWKISIAGLSGALLQAMDQTPDSLDFGPDDTFQADPATRFAIREAQLHRERGVSLAMFLGLLKYYRQAYLDLVRTELAPATRKKAADIVARFFDRVEIGIVLEWSACERDALLEELQNANRNLTNEKNKYLTVFESLALPAFLFDDAGWLLHASQAAVQWLRLRTPPGLEYYLERSAMADQDAAEVEIAASEILPDLATDIMACCGQSSPRVQLERAIHLGDEERYYIVTLGRLLDFSGKFAGVVVTLEDITDRRALEQELLDKQERLSETVRKRMTQLEAANKQLEREIERRAALEEALRKGAQYYRAIVEDQAELICRFTPDCTLTFVNQTYCRFFGKTESALLGKSFLPFIPDDHRVVFLEHLRAITPNMPLRVIEHATLSPDGSMRWIRWTDRGLFDPAGKVIEYQSVGSDITEQHQVQEELRQLNAELEHRVAERTRAAEDKASRLEEEIMHRKTTEERLAHAYRLAAIQGQVASAFLTEQDEEVFSAVLQLLLKATDSEQGIFAYLDEEGAMVAPSLTRDVWDKCRIPDKTIRFPRDTWAESSCIWVRAIREKRLLVKNEPGSAPEGHVPISCALVAPILHSGTVIGLFMLANRPGGYGHDEQEITEDACLNLAPLLHAWLQQQRLEAQRRKAEDALRRRLEMEQVMAGVAGQLIGMHFEEVANDLPPLLGIVAGAVGADMVRVCGTDPNDGTCISVWCSDRSPQAEALCPGLDMQAHSWFMSKLANLEDIVIRKPGDLPAEAAAERAEFTRTGIHSLLAVPLVKGNTLTGCLGFVSRQTPRDWSPEDVSLIETFAHILANAIESARLERTLRYNERRYFDLIDNLEEGLWSVDLEGKTTFVNKSMARMLGYETDEMLGTTPQSFLTEEGARYLGLKLTESRQGVSHKHSMEFLHKDGHRVFVSISGRPVRNEQGEIVGSLALMSDQSKERLLQLQLVQAQRLEAIGQLAAGIAHEINTPTQYVDNNVQFLRAAFEGMQAVLREFDGLLREARGGQALAETIRRVEAARQAQKLDTILADIPGAFDDASDGLQRISLIVDSVKRFAHPNQGTMAPADLNDALRSTIVVARNEWKYVAEVATELDPLLPPVPCVLSDINQVVLNLIVNAAHAIASARGSSPDAKGLITVRTRSEDGWAVIEVQDTGTGIPREIRSRIFDPFFTTKEVGKGTGQGLAIARTVVVEKHRGSIHFETEEGKGTTFIVRLPLRQNQEHTES